MGLHRNEPYTFGDGKYHSTPDFTPLNGLKLYFSESGYLLTFIAMVAYALVCINMSAIEMAESGSILCLIGIAASLLLLAGGVLVLLSSIFNELPGIFMFFGLLMLFFSCLCYIGTALSTVMSDVSLLGIVQGMFELVFLASLAAGMIPLIITCLGKRTSPMLGYLPSVACLFASLLLLVRTVSSFATLTSALGLDFNWESAQDCPTEIRWVLRTVSTTSPNASQMYYARLFERIMLIILLFSALSLLFRFASFFKQYNSQMDINAEMPGAHVQKPLTQGRGRHKRNKEEKTDILAGLNTLRKKPSETEVLEEEDEPEQITDNSYTAPGFISGFDEPEEEYLPRRSYQPEPQSQQPVRQPDVVYNTNLLDADYGKAIDSKGGEEADNPQSEGENQPERNSETGAYKVKLKMSIPDPKDKSIWDNYED